MNAQTADAGRWPLVQVDVKAGRNWAPVYNGRCEETAAKVANEWLSAKLPRPVQVTTVYATGNSYLYVDEQLREWVRRRLPADAAAS